MIFCENTTRNKVKKEYPSAVKILKVDGGYAVFLTWNEYYTWINQK